MRQTLAMAVMAAAVLGGVACSISSLLDAPSAADAQVQIAPASVAELTAGKPVRIRLRRAAAAQKVASSVRIEAEADETPAGLQGAVSEVNVAANTLTVLGLTVRLAPSTRLDGASSISDLAVGQEVDVRGLPDSRGGLAASEVRARIPEVRGTIQSASALAGGGTTLSVLGQRITIPASAPVTVDLREYRRVALAQGQP
jgi:hypothetical protein